MGGGWQLVAIHGQQRPGQIQREVWGSHLSDFAQGYVHVCMSSSEATE